MLALFIAAFAVILHYTWPEYKEKITIDSYNHSWKIGPESNKFEIGEGLFSLRPQVTYSYEGQTYTTYENALGLPAEPKKIEDKNILFELAENSSNNYQKIYQSGNYIYAMYVATINGIPYYTIESRYIEKDDSYRIAYREVSQSKTEISFETYTSNVILGAFIWSASIFALIYVFAVMPRKKPDEN